MYRKTICQLTIAQFALYAILGTQFAGAVAKLIMKFYGV